MLEQIVYQLPRISEIKHVIYRISDLESLSASALYYGNSGSGFKGGSFGSISKGEVAKFGIVATPLMKSNVGESSSFRPASSFGIGQGMARKMSEVGNMIERVRKDDDLPSHLNYEYLVPGEKTTFGKQKWITLANIHIDLKD
ncbi:MAG: hypothetical protein ABIH65_00775 [Nanoarchaeota archaeon]